MVSFISFILVLGILVFVHEFGHYITAKIVGIRVEEFALGFGPKLFGKKYGETMYSLRIIPFGGFCQMTGENPPDDKMSEEERLSYEEARKEGRTFPQKSPLQRFAVILNGAMMNFLLAILIFALIFAIYGIAVESVDSNIIGDVALGTPAAEAGLKIGDKIIAIEGQAIEKWGDISGIISNAEGQPLEVKFIRNNQEYTTTVVPRYEPAYGYAMIGIAPETIREKTGFFQSLRLGFLQTVNLLWFTITAIVKMITGKLTVDVGGPIMIATMVNQATGLGWASLLNLTAVLSLNLGFFNLLPFPALDGGRLIFIIYEMIRGKPVDQEKESLVHVIGLVILMILMVFVFIRDIARFL
ncbi:MAG: RIP metalloprotease RseP [Halanaerobiales bacterium]|jgi:regulator of sigma E protease|nr:RIP metalloprotease RseP [Bacillota bacterium]